jgi:uncharacterized protein (TIGR02246 family)
MRIRFVPLFVSAILVVMVVIAQVDAGQALRDWGDRWTELYNLGDFEGVVDLYTEDAIFGNTYGVFEGREAILEFYVQPAPEESAIQLFTDEVEVFGDTAYSMGTYVVLATDGSTLIQGSWMARSKLVDGVWKMHRQVVNMLMPPPEAPAP